MAFMNPILDLSSKANEVRAFGNVYPCPFSGLIWVKSYPSVLCIQILVLLNRWCLHLKIKINFKVAPSEALKSHLLSMGALSIN